MNKSETIRDLLKNHKEACSVRTDQLETGQAKCQRLETLLTSMTKLRDLLAGPNPPSLTLTPSTGGGGVTLHESLSPQATVMLESAITEVGSQLDAAFREATGIEEDEPPLGL